MWFLTRSEICFPQKKKTSYQINHPYDWYKLVESCGKRTKFVVKQMETENMFDFADLLKGKLIMRKINVENEKVNWRQIKWLRVVRESPGILRYKETLTKENEFKTINCRRKKKDLNFEFGGSGLKLCSDGPIPISSKKKQHLSELCSLNLIDKTFHPFYNTLITDSRAAVDPDLADLTEEDDE